METQGAGLTRLGKFTSWLLVIGLIVLGGYVVVKKVTGNGATTVGVSSAERTGNGGGVARKAGFEAEDLLAETKMEVPTLAAGLAYVPQNNVVEIELSRYAGYSGIVAANGGLNPNADSVFARKYGFQVRLILSEEESWNKLNGGKLAASVTTADVLAAYGRQLQVTVPVQIGYSRGADGLVVRNDIRRFNQLKGRIVAAEQFTESDFFVRYLAHEAGIEVKMLETSSTPVDSDKINIVYCKDGDAVGALLRKDLEAGTNTIAGAMTWAPTTTELVDSSGGKLRMLTTNKNLLIIADVLIVNRGFAEKHPDKVAGLVDGILTGNRMVREHPEQYAEMLGKAFRWAGAKTSAELRARSLAELQKVHLSNLPENMAFFGGGITSGGSFAGIYQSSVLAYGPDLIRNPVDSDHFSDLEALKKAEASGAYRDQVAAITPLASASGGPIERDPLLSKDIRFLFLPNDDRLDLTQKANLDNLNAIKRMVDVSPGSRVLLRGHVDDSSVSKFRQQGGEELVRKMALEAMDLSKRRAATIKQLLLEREKVDAKRIETVGRGWEEPAGTNPDANRRVEVQWFTLE